MLEPASLNGPRAKLRRAQEHLEALDAEARAYGEREPYSVTRERDPLEGWQVAYFHIHEPPPIRLGIILGDFFYNLRSCLDHLAWQLVLLDGGTPGDHTAFPVIRDFGNWKSGGGGVLKGIGKGHFDAIETLQPYPTRNDPCSRALEVVDTCCNRDKHKTLHPAFAVLDPRPEALILQREPFFAANVEVHYPGAGKPLEDGAEFARLHVTTPEPQPGAHMEVEFPIVLGFGESGLAIKSLPQIAMLIESVVEQFTPDF